MFATNTLLIQSIEFVPSISFEHSLKQALRECTRLHYFIINNYTNAHKLIFYQERRNMHGRFGSIDSFVYYENELFGKM